MGISFDVDKCRKKLAMNMSPSTTEICGKRARLILALVPPGASDMVATSPVRYVISQKERSKCSLYNSIEYNVEIP